MVKGELQIDKWSHTQWRLELTNRHTKVTELIVLNASAMAELIHVLGRVHRGDLPSAILMVDEVGAPVDYDGKADPRPPAPAARA